MSLGEMYNYWIVEQRDPYTREWPLISSPFPLILIILGYLCFIFYVGPCYMKDRPPYELRPFRLIYDIIQILANLWFVKEHFSAGWFSELNSKYIICGERNALNLNVIKLHNLIWWLLLLKLFDFVETCTFVLRKKQNQVSSLHVYHHVANVIAGWYYLTFYLDERATFISLVNCAVHVIMYTYYLIAAWSPESQQMIFFIKPYITKLQMAQFILMIVVILQVIHPNCKIEKKYTLGPIFVGNLLIFLYLFYDFYKKNYAELSKQKNN